MRHRGLSARKKGPQSLRPKAPRAPVPKNKMVEMAGVEPASPGLSAETSTRLASRLDFGDSWSEGARNRLPSFPFLASRERRQVRGFTCFFDSPSAQQASAGATVPQLQAASANALLRSNAMVLFLPFDWLTHILGRRVSSSACRRNLRTGIESGTSP